MAWSVGDFDHGNVRWEKNFHIAERSNGLRLTPPQPLLINSPNIVIPFEDLWFASFFCWRCEFELLSCLRTPSLALCWWILIFHFHCSAVSYFLPEIRISLLYTAVTEKKTLNRDSQHSREVERRRKMAMKIASNWHTKNVSHSSNRWQAAAVWIPQRFFLFFSPKKFIRREIILCAQLATGWTFEGFIFVENIFLCFFAFCKCEFCENCFYRTREGTRFNEFESFPFRIECGGALARK